MLRITNIRTPDAIVLKLDGKLLAAWVEEVRSACESAGGSAPVRLDLSQVSYIDASGIRLLAELLSRGVTIAAQSSYVAELLHGALS